MTGDETYNGWPNRATWLAYLHLSNDPGLLTFAEEVARVAYDGWEPSEFFPDPDKPHWVQGARVAAAATALREWAEDTLRRTCGLDDGHDPLRIWAGDVLGDWIGRVWWRDVAYAVLDEEPLPLPDEG